MSASEDASREDVRPPGGGGDAGAAAAGAAEGEEQGAQQAAEASSSSSSAAAAATAASAAEEPELKDLESSLLALEKLDRASPDLWPDHFPGVSQFVPLATPQDSPANQGELVQGLTQEDINTIHQLGNLPVSMLLNEVKRLHDVAYELGIEERKEMTRGKYLNIFKKRR